jgi:hypothetical protein
MNVELEFICDSCGSRIADGDGVIRMSFGQLSDYKRAMAETQPDRTPGRVFDMAAFLARPSSVPWHIQHLVCRPEGDDAYEIDVEQVRTWRALLGWTAHLMEKNWLASTTWAAVIGSAARGEHAGIVPARVHGDAA